tara:strand:- start:999 stop:1205 length:207 start_codon:yes stop_codon:yes gene_type:complete
MFEGSDRVSWVHTATLQATQASIAGGKNVSSEKFHPYMQNKKIDNLKQRLEAVSERNKINARRISEDN